MSQYHSNRARTYYRILVTSITLVIPGYKVCVFLCVCMPAHVFVYVPLQERESERERDSVSIESGSLIPPKEKSAIKSYTKSDVRCFSTGPTCTLNIHTLNQTEWDIEMHDIIYLTTCRTRNTAKHSVMQLRNPPSQAW
jgi:hypothetical protein